MKKCDCENIGAPGILAPTEWDDSGPSVDGRVYVTKHEDCDRYRDDEDAAFSLASAIESVRIVRRATESNDWTDGTDVSIERDENGHVFLPVTLDEAERGVGRLIADGDERVYSGTVSWCCQLGRGETKEAAARIFLEGLVEIIQSTLEGDDDHGIFSLLERLEEEGARGEIVVLHPTEKKS